jgi:hypothetical protein
MAVPKKKISKSRSLIKLNNKIESLNENFIKVNYLIKLFPTFFFNKLKKTDLLNKSFYYTKLNTYKEIMEMRVGVEINKLFLQDKLEVVLNSYKTSKVLNPIKNRFLKTNLYFVANKVSRVFFKNFLIKSKARIIK